MNNLVWTHKAWQDYLYWQTQDKKNFEKDKWISQRYWKKWSFKRNRQARSIKNESAYSRRIDEKNRLVYRIVDGFTWIIACKGHYEE